jgi:hypothetical protein
VQRAGQAQSPAAVETLDEAANRPRARALQLVEQRPPAAREPDRAGAAGGLDEPAPPQALDAGAVGPGDGQRADPAQRDQVVGLEAQAL